MMSILIKLSQGIADAFDKILDKSLGLGKARFGLCQYDTVDNRITDIYHADDCEKDWEMTATAKNAYPPEELMEIVCGFNDQNQSTVLLGRKEFARKSSQSFRRQNGILVPYHTHPDPEDDFFSSHDGADSDTAFTFVKYALPIDIVVSANARGRGIRPPLCATFNPVIYPYETRDINSALTELRERDAQRGLEDETYLTVYCRQHSTKRRMSIDFLIDPSQQ